MQFIERMWTIILWTKSKKKIGYAPPVIGSKTTVNEKGKIGDHNVNLRRIRRSSCEQKHRIQGPLDKNRRPNQRSGEMRMPTRNMHAGHNKDNLKCACRVKTAKKHVSTSTYQGTTMTIQNTHAELESSRTYTTMPTWNTHAVQEKFLWRKT